MFGDTYRNKSVFVTGHTGFKGSWLTLWLQKLGAHVCGYALEPETAPSHWEALNLDIESQFGDIRDFEQLATSMREAQPEIVFHLAAQSLVSLSYSDPLKTWSTNLMGTATLLEACREIPSIKAVVIVTTDKVYADQNWEWGYREEDELGGDDPYSASKAASEILVKSYRKSFLHSPGPLIATARAGNVIGGGDWSKDRLIPDLIRAIEQREPLKVRAPLSIRPWQHVLDSLYGYLLLGEKLFKDEEKSASCWNFGPPASDNWRVLKVLHHIKKHWSAVDWSIDTTRHFKETACLCLDATRAQHRLGWKSVWPLEEALEKTIEWYRAWLEEGEVLSEIQLDNYIFDLQKSTTNGTSTHKLPEGDLSAHSL